MAHATYSLTITLKDGSAATHTAEALSYWHASDGAVVVEAACCGLVDGEQDTRSRHTFYDVAREVAGPDGKPVMIDPEAEVRAHVQRVAEHHAAVHRAKSFKLDGLMKPDPVPAPDPAPEPAPVPPAK
jgi:hypothetical protein